MLNLWRRDQEISARPQLGEGIGVEVRLPEVARR
jgi:hypothetical protein